MLDAREAPRGEVGIAVSGVIRSTPAVRAADATTRSRDVRAGTETDRLTRLENDVEDLKTVTVRLTTVVEALNKKIDAK